MFGRRARIPVDLLCGTGEMERDVSVNSYVSQQSRILEAAYHQVQNRMGLQQDRQKKHMIGEDMESPSKKVILLCCILLLSLVAIVKS